MRKGAVDMEKDVVQRDFDVIDREDALAYKGDGFIKQPGDGIIWPPGILWPYI